MKNLILILTTLSIFSACTTTKETKEEAKRPNILFIMADDHAYEAISAYNDRLIQTPNIDRIAEEGAIFNNCFVTNSICGPSRATLFTGKMSHKNGFIANYMCEFDSTQNTLQKDLQSAGYNTAIVGKWHLGSTPTNFDFYRVLPDQGEYYNPDFIEMNGDTVQYNGYVTDLTTDFALDWLSNRDKEEKEKPFMLFLHQKAPHRNWMPDVDKLEMYDDLEFPKPENFGGDFSKRGKATASKESNMSIKNTMSWGHDLKFTDHPKKYKNYRPDGEWMENHYLGNLARMSAEDRKKWEAYYEPKNKIMKERLENGTITEEEFLDWKYQRYMHDYLTTISSVDDNVGRVLDYLKENGLEENTIVVYTSDQSFFLGENGWFDKRFMYEQSLKMPFLIKYPEHIKPKSEVNDMAMNIDFAPTFLEYAGVPIRSDIQGSSMKSILEGNTPKDWRNSVYYHYYQYPGTHDVKRHYGVRTERYKLIHFYYDVDEWEMYDLKNDPMEANNIYDNPEFATEKAELLQLLKDNEKEYDINEKSALELHKSIVDRNNLNL